MDGADVAAWEGVARGLLADTGFDDGEPVCAFELATVCGFKIRPRRGPQRIDLAERTIHLDFKQRWERQQAIVAHELGHWALGRAREEPRDEESEQAAWFVGASLIVPRESLYAQLRKTQRLDDLALAHPNASRELLGRRIIETRSGFLTIIDNGRIRKRIASPHIETAPPPQLSPLERDLVQAAYKTARPARLGLTQAVPVFEGWRERVVLVTAA